MALFEENKNYSPLCESTLENVSEDISLSSIVQYLITDSSRVPKAIAYYLKIQSENSAPFRLNKCSKKS